MTHFYIPKCELCEVVEEYLIDGMTYYSIILQNSSIKLTLKNNVIELEKLTPEQKLKYL